MKYGKIELYIAKKLQDYPFLIPIVKFPYRYYRRLHVAYHNKGFTIQTHPKASISGILGQYRNNLEAFFGYYDKTPWSWDSKYYLVHIFDKQHKDRVKIAVYDQDSTDLRIIDSTPAFNFQQGAMLRWLNRGDYHIIYNTVQNGNLIARITDAFSGDRIKDIPMPIQTTNIEGTEALTLNYKRLAKIIPQYGYMIDVKNFDSNTSSKEDGIWRVDLVTGKSELIINLAYLMSLNTEKSMKGAKHKINHIMYSPSGKRFVFMHRWLNGQKKTSRLYTANPDGSGIYCLADDKLVSHYCWVDDYYLMAWMRKESIGNKYFLLKDRSTEYRVIGDTLLDESGDGHPSIHPNKEWVITDSYPDKSRIRKLILFNLRTGENMIIGNFIAPWIYDDSYRCDLHPRWSPDGTMISIDSAHEGFRNSYIIDVSEIIT